MPKSTSYAALYLAMTMVASPAMAHDDDDDDDDSYCEGLDGQQWMSLKEVERIVSEQGYTVRSVERDDGCYDIDAWNEAGERVELVVHPTSGEVLAFDLDD